MIKKEFGNTKSDKNVLKVEVIQNIIFGITTKQKRIGLKISMEEKLLINFICGMGQT